MVSTPTTRVDGVTHLHKTLDESVQYILDVADDYLRVADLTPRALEGATVLEIGPGDSLGVAFVLAGFGARRVVCVDRYLIHRDPEREGRILDELERRASPEMRKRMRRCRDGASGVGGVVSHLPGVAIEEAASRLPDAGFDFIVSRAVLQFVYDIHRTYANCRRLVRDDGRIIHKVDLTNLSSVEHHPLQFLTYPSWLWRRMSSNLSRPNRWRWSQHRAALEQHGFLIERFEVTKLFEPDVVASIRSRLRPPFATLSDEDLRIAGFFVVCRPRPRMAWSGER
jgi:SAM-dependent methyltransferase